MNEWIAAAIAVIAALLLGSIAGRFTQTWLGKERQPQALRSVAAPLGSLVFSIFLIAGLMTALGFVQKEALDQIPEDLVNYLPSVLSAAIVLIGANVIAQLAQTAIERSVARMPGGAARNIPSVTRFVILAFGAILAAAQLGIDTTIINLAVAAVLFSIGLGAALMIGLGSRRVAGDVAAGRALRRIVSVGDEIEVDGVQGTVVALQSVAVEVDAGDGQSLLVPNNRVLEHTVTIRRASSDSATDDD